MKPLLRRVANLEARRAASGPSRVVLRFIDTDGRPRQPEPEVDENTTVITVHFVDSPPREDAVPDTRFPPANRDADVYDPSLVPISYR